ncbi:hypothetical protein FSP39_003619 [Pinctada imbricata]|uniref:G-protein coupled receptors family 1 profile domain-containing protein n=1 Tax=Pinctada imbricata TaxID=66713 RepID=A0AA88XYT3_PINIB|nr:hypothetical protein FSP39_003619 [Pinctada imbricata]
MKIYQQISDGDNENTSGPNSTNHSGLLSAIIEEFKQNDRWFDSRTETFFIILYSVVIVTGVLGNSIVCYVVWRYKHLRKPRNLLIVNLAACDIIMCLFCLPFSLMKLTIKNWYFGEFLCRVVPSLQNIDVFVSTFSVVGIAIDRYWAIVCVVVNDAHQHMTSCMILIIWVLAIVFCLPMVIFNSVMDVGDGLLKVCAEAWPSSTVKALYTIFVMVIQYMLPLIIISSIHAKICHVLRSRIQRDPITRHEMQRALRDIKRHKKNMLLLTTVAVTFAITWLPWTVLNVTADFEYYFLKCNFNFWYAICLLVAMCSSCTNPILYGWFNANFREAFSSSFFFWRKLSTDSMEMATFKTDSRDKERRSPIGAGIEQESP